MIPVLELPPMVKVLQCATATTGTNSSHKTVWIRVGTLLDGVSSQPLCDAHLVYDAECIRYVGSHPPPSDLMGSGRHEPDAVLADQTVLPGLIEAHAHLFLAGYPLDAKIRENNLKLRADELLRNARARMQLLLKVGIAGIRDAGDNRGIGLALSSHKKFNQLSPYIDSPGAALHRRGRYGSFMAVPIEDFASLEACVEDRCERGADRIKLIVSDIINFKKGAVTKPPQLSIEDVKALAASAAHRGRQTFAHASGVDGIENALQGGVSSIEHGFFITQDQLAFMRDQAVAWVPTFTPVQVQIDRASEMGWSAEIVSMLKQIIEGHCESLRRGSEMGVRILAGSDAGSCGVPHGTGLLKELELMERAGMSSLAVLNAATGNSAAHLGFKEPIGRLAAGYRSRMIFLKNSPLKSVTQLQGEKLIVHDGHVIESNGNFAEDLL